MASVYKKVGLTNTATMPACGTSSESSSSRLETISGVMTLKPVTLPPGRGETGNQSDRDQVAGHENDRDRRGCVFRR